MYQCQGKSGLTDEAGTFDYIPEKQIIFRIGSIIIGDPVIARPLMTPLDVVAGADDIRHPVVTNISRFLQSLDDNRYPDDGIVISYNFV